MTITNIFATVEEYRKKYGSIKIDISGTVKNTTELTLNISYWEEIDMNTHPDFFKKNGGGICLVTKTFYSEDSSKFTIDRTPIFECHWSKEYIDEHKF